MSPDPAASKAFYDGVVHYSSDADPVAPGVDYRMIKHAVGGNADGVLRHRGYAVHGA